MDYQPPAIIKQAPAIVTGDSIATGIGHNGRRGNTWSDAQWGRSPSSQLNLMTQRGQRHFSGRDVVLSTGILNHTDWKSVRGQFEFLSLASARSVKVAGTPFPGMNQRLSSLCDEYGFVFLGGYQAGSDGIHPASYSGMITE